MRLLEIPYLSFPKVFIHGYGKTRKRCAREKGKMGISSTHAA